MPKGKKTKSKRGRVAGTLAFNELRKSTNEVAKRAARLTEQVNRAESTYQSKLAAALQ